MKIPICDERLVLTDTPSTLQPPSTRKRQARTISFAQQDVIHAVLSLAEYAHEEIQLCWFTRAEYNSFKRNALATLNLNRSGELSPNDPEHTMRGLECRTRECTEGRRVARWQATMIVLNEQARQRNLGIRDPEALSEAYHNISWHSMYDAHTQGMADKQDSQAFLADNTVPKFFATSAPASPASPAGKRSAMASKRKSNVLSKIISIERIEPEIFLTATRTPSTPQTLATNTLFGNSLLRDCGLQSNSSSANNYLTNSFDLHSFFYDMSVGGSMIGVAAA